MPVVRHHSREHLPKLRAVVAFAKMYHFVDEHVIGEADRQLEHTPVEIKPPPFAA